MELDTNTPIEVWKDIKGYEGLYQVSNLGRVKSLKRTASIKGNPERTFQERILKPYTNQNGYWRVKLCSRKGKKEFYIHRLVCEAFYKNSENKPCVNHIDEDKTNNTASNLEWCTYAENNNHGTHNAKIGEANVKNKSKPVGQYTRDGELVKIWQSTMEVQRQLGFAHGYISTAAQGKYKTAYGYVWKYIEKEK